MKPDLAIESLVDDEGNPLVNQRVHYVWPNDYPRKTWGEYANTDTNGEFVAQAKVGGEMTVGVRQIGYYKSWDKIVFYAREGVSPAENI